MWVPGSCALIGCADRIERRLAEYPVGSRVDNSLESRGTLTRLRGGN
jgi:hypothetical protein